MVSINSGKQNINLGKHNNQNFVQIPFYKLLRMLTYLGEWNGIRVVEQEESYASRASFLDDDFMPAYGDKNTFFVIDVGAAFDNSIDSRR